MGDFAFSRDELQDTALLAGFTDPSCGALATFAGRVRNHSEGRAVIRLEYEAYEQLGLREGQRILDEARRRWPIGEIHCVHRLGRLEIGDVAVWVGVAAAHRDAAFAACRFVIDEIKARVPIWKKEHYADGDSGWVNCHCPPDGGPVQPPDSASRA